MSQAKKLSLEERIAGAFSAGTKSEAVAALVREVDTAALALEEAAERARERALDPTLSSADLAAARSDMEDVAFRRDRMKVALARLLDRAKELEHKEEQQRRWDAYEKTMAERDALAAELKELFSPFEAHVIDLLARIEANDRVIERINTRENPEGAPWLAGAEQVARGLQGYVVGGVTNVPRITRDLRLPAFRYEPMGEYVWPRRV